MKNISLIIFSSLIAFILNLPCNPLHNGGVEYTSQCVLLEKSYIYNECCKITYTDYDDKTYSVCYELSAYDIFHFEQVKQTIKDIIFSFYPDAPKIYSIDYYTCSSTYLKVALLSLVLILF